MPRLRKTPQDGQEQVVYGKSTDTMPDVVRQHMDELTGSQVPQNDMPDIVRQNMDSMSTTGATLPLQQGLGMETEAPTEMKVIGREEVLEAMQTLQRYKDGKASLDQRIVENEQWYKMRHWEQIRNKHKEAGDPEPASGYLFNCLANKHADFMDNVPEPQVLPREQSDIPSAETLTEVVPVVLEQNRYRQTYSDTVWQKIKTGTGVTGVFWDASKENGLGDIDVRKVDILNLFWEPGVDDIQKSRNVFHVDLMDADIVNARFPGHDIKSGSESPQVTRYILDDTVDTSDKVAVVDWYYKVDNGSGKPVLHYCKFCGEAVLYASENDPAYAERGFYDHGKFPFVFDRLFPEEGTCFGFGYVDVCKDAQIYIDKLDQVHIKHAVMGSNPRFFIKGDGNVNESEYADWTKAFVHFTGSSSPSESVMPIEIPSIPEIYVNIRQMKIDELKEVSSNRDWSQGGTSGGVTAASAISALIESGSKVSRSMIYETYTAYEQICYMVIDLMRQFYDEQRMFRITGKQGEVSFVPFSGQQIRGVPQGDVMGVDTGIRVPVFDVKAVAQKSSPFSTAAQNERAMTLYAAGFFNPQMADQAMAALDMMQFEGIEQVREDVSRNSLIPQLQKTCMELATIVDSIKGTNIAQNLAASMGSGAHVAGNPADEAKGGEMKTNSLGDEIGGGDTALNKRAREKVASSTSPNGQ